MEFFPSLLDRQQSDDLAATIRRLIKQRGWGFWAIEIPEIANFIGFAGLHIPRDDLPFSPCTEIGWRLAFEFWGKGYASEAAQAVLELGFKNLGLAEIVSFTAASNRRSRAVMARIGMRHAGECFEHPGITPGHPLSLHVLYRINNPFTAFPPR